MKTLKITLATLIISLSLGALNAKADDGHAANTSANSTINSYMDAIVHGKTAGLDGIFDNTVKFTMLRGEKLVSFNKAETLAYLKTTNGVEQNCLTTATITESNTDLNVVKVDMQYTNFTRTNYVTLINTAQGWKITNVYSVFKK
jgi:hypothetical protein